MQVLLAYRRASRRVILLDWGGTLTPADSGFYDQREEGGFTVPDATLSLLQTLCSEPQNHVMILSGLGRDKVQRAFGEVPNLSLAVEHGFHFRIKNGPWQQLKPGVDISWREVADAIMRVYSTRTSGSFVQRKGASVVWNLPLTSPPLPLPLILTLTTHLSPSPGASIVWNHQHADPEFGTMQARELQYHLQGVLAAFAVVVRAGKGYVEACPKGINKGVMAERIIELEQADTRAAQQPSSARRGSRSSQSQSQRESFPGDAEPLDFVLCIGDDSSDELMFQALQDALGTSTSHSDLFTCTVGRKPSSASAYLGDHSDVVELLKMLASLSATKRKAHASAGDLTKVELSFGGQGLGGKAGLGRSTDALPRVL